MTLQKRYKQYILSLNPFTAVMSRERPTKVRNLKLLSLLIFFFALAWEQTFIKTHNVENRFVKGPENILFCRRVPACTLQPGNFTGCDSAGLNGAKT